MKCKTCKHFRIDKDIRSHSGSYNSYYSEIHLTCDNIEAIHDRDYRCLKSEEVKEKVDCKRYKRSIFRSIYNMWKIFWIPEYKIN